MNRIKNTEEWFKLDNASKIYPASGNARWNAVYRVCAVMKDRVDREVLQQALDVVIERFPSYNVILRRGFFWYFLQGATLRPVVTREKDYPCRKFDIMNREPLFRVMYSGNRIMAEFSHCISDGNASINFLNTLILKYLHLYCQQMQDVLHTLGFQTMAIKCREYLKVLPLLLAPPIVCHE